jgi:hypothetical protein
VRSRWRSRGALGRLSSLPAITCSWGLYAIDSLCSGSFPGRRNSVRSGCSRTCPGHRRHADTRPALLVTGIAQDSAWCENVGSRRRSAEGRSFHHASLVSGRLPHRTPLSSCRRAGHGDPGDLPLGSGRQIRRCSAKVSPRRKLRRDAARYPSLRRDHGAHGNTGQWDRSLEGHLRESRGRSAEQDHPLAATG